jgi:hypothetical protein
MPCGVTRTVTVPSPFQRCATETPVMRSESQQSKRAP